MNKNILTVAVLTLILSACGATITPTLVPTMPSITTIAPTNTPVPTATLSPTGTPAPLSTFPAPYANMSSPALMPLDIRLNVKNDLVTAIFFLQDVPTELTFDKESGVLTGGIEYMWKVCIDTDNNKDTGASAGFLAGADYCLWAAHFKSSDASKTMPIQQGVQVAVSQLNGESETKVSDGTIRVDTKGKTIELSGKISGITDSSLLYYQIDDGYYGGTIASPLFDRIFIEK
jgi:hypothetical protein